MTEEVEEGECYDCSDVVLTYAAWRHASATADKYFRKKVNTGHALMFGRNVLQRTSVHLKWKGHVLSNSIYRVCGAPEGENRADLFH